LFVIPGARPQQAPAALPNVAGNVLWPASCTSRLKRLLVMAQTGFISFEALRWLNDIGAAFV
jgi:hypothetical protein